MANPKSKARGVPATREIPKALAPEKPQRERFIEAAREAGVTDEGFEKALTEIARPKKGSANSG